MISPIALIIVTATSQGEANAISAILFGVCFSWLNVSIYLNFFSIGTFIGMLRMDKEELMPKPPTNKSAKIYEG